MLSVDRLIASAAECLGWPYESPGTNDSRGIDCSGLFVKCFRDQGASIYHGSNTIYRKYCTDDKGPLSRESQLVPGMVVFKHKDQDPATYTDGLGDFSHIGLVTGTNPLSIIHASSVAGCVTTDTKLGKWSYYGRLKDVDYGTMPTPEPESEPVMVTKKVYAENGKPVNLRHGPSRTKRILTEVPVGETVVVTQTKGGWAKVSWGGKEGWMMASFLVDPDDPEQDLPKPESVPEPTAATVIAENGKPVKMRARPSVGCDLYDDLPVGTVVRVDRYADDWCRITCGSRKGWYIMTKFLSFEDFMQPQSNEIG